MFVGLDGYNIWTELCVISVSYTHLDVYKRQAVYSYRPDEKEVGKIASIDNMLQGKIAGLSIGASIDAPGAASSVTIRGANSLRGDNQPLYVIDNIPQASTGDSAHSGNDGTFTLSLIHISIDFCVYQ